MQARRFLSVLIFFLAVVGVDAGVQTKSVTNAYGTITVNYDEQANTINWSYSFTRDATIYGAGWLYRHANADDTYPSASAAQVIFDTSASLGNVSNSGTFTPVAGGHYRLYIRAQYRSNNTVAIGQTTAYLLATPLGAGQTVTITPSAAMLVVGKSVLLNASGAKNGYSWSASGTGATLAYKDSAAIVQASLSAKETDSFVVTVWSPAGNGYTESNHAEAVINFKLKEEGAGDHTATVTFDNRSRNYPVRFNVWQNGQVVYTEVVGAGKLVQKKIKLPSDAPYTVTAVIKDPVLTPDGVWTEGEEKEVMVGTGTPGGSQDGTAPPEPEDPETPPEPDIEADPIGYFQNKVQGYIDAALSKSDEIAKKGEDNAKWMTDHFSMPAHTVPVASPETGSIALGTHGGKVLSILKNPFDSSGPFGGVLSTVAALVKRIIGWAAVAGFVAFFFDRIYRVIADANQTTAIPSVISDGISNAAAGIGNIVSIPARVVVCVAVATLALGFPIILFTALKIGLPFSQIQSTFAEGAVTVNSAGGPASVLSRAWALAGQVVPWEVLFAVPLWGFVVRFLIIPKLFFWQMFYKFLPT